MNKHLRRLAVLPAAGVIALAIAGPASAHVTVASNVTAAGGEAILTFSVPHGCDGSATTKISIKMPDDVVEATPTRNPFYDVEKVTKKLATPITAEDGDQITEKVDQIIYTARTPLPDGERDSFEVGLDIPEGDAGTSLVFPTVQTCEKGETAWTEIPAAGAAEDSVEHPAPAFEVTAAESDGDAGATPAAATPAAATPDSSTPPTTPPTTTAAVPAGTQDHGDGSGLAVAGLVAGLLGLALGGFALARTRGRA
jgi:uncharacterized protein YcnI